MRYLFVLLVALLFSSCGSSKKVVDAEKSIPSSEVTEPRTVKETGKGVLKSPPPANTVREAEIKPIEVEPINDDEPVEINPQRMEFFNHTAWDLLLKDHVSSSGIVDYEGFRSQKGLLRDYIASLGAHIPVEAWPKADKLAYWMNAYNAMTVDLIVRNLPLTSIKDIKDPWNQRLWKLGAKWYNLDEIEHQILRKMAEPRIHFGINCASFSCPPLLNEAFTSHGVDSQLEVLTRRFINDPERNTLSEEAIEISKIFSWFATDFKNQGSIIDFLNKYSEITIDPNARKRFKTYNWALNNK